MTHISNLAVVVEGKKPPRVGFSLSQSFLIFHLPLSHIFTLRNHSPTPFQPLYLFTQKECVRVWDCCLLSLYLSWILIFLRIWKYSQEWLKLQQKKRAWERDLEQFFSFSFGVNLGLLQGRFEVGLE